MMMTLWVNCVLLKCTQPHHANDVIKVAVGPGGIGVDRLLAQGQALISNGTNVTEIHRLHFVEPFFVKT